MDECLYVRFRNRKVLWPVRDVTNEGVILEEPDPCPRRALLDFQPRGDVTEARIEDIRRNFGWHPWQFQLQAKNENGLLAFRGMHRDALPPGFYRIRLELEGLDCSTPAGSVQLPPNGAATVNVQVRPDTRRVIVNLAKCDAEIARVLDVPACVDNRSVREWPGSDAREARKACLLNVLASLRVVPSPSDPLVRHLERVVSILDDRVYALVAASMHERVKTMALDQENKKFWSEGAPTSPSHRLLLGVLSAEERALPYKLESYRAEGPAGIQIVFAVPPDGTAGHYYADIDIDLGNPLQDVAGFAIHMGELIDGRLTDHLDLYRKLSKKTTGDFLYYRVANA